ncbi:MAG: transketolase [Erysipelotrichaceae bacterium]|nr:transketolase [Erysipelotrichaceae bacterium]
MELKELKVHAKNIRKNILKQVYNAQSGHPGGSLGATDILTVLYFDVMDITPENAKGIDRDRFVLSKGHVSPLLYAVLAEKGILPMEELMTFRLIDSKLQGHPNMNYVTGVDMSTGSLGQGFAVADGMALANKLDGNDHRIYCLIGDGETEEGEIWEAAMAAAHYKNDNLCAIVDVNGLQIDGNTADVIGPEPLDEKFASFGFHVIKVDGHNMEELKAAFDEAKTVKGKPTAIIARTVKGKGVSFMENNAGWHGKAPNKEQFEAAMAELEAK